MAVATVVNEQLPLHLAIPAGSLYGTRTSGRWSTQPAKVDVLNTRLLFPHTGPWGIPALQPCDFRPESLAAWHDPGARARASGCGAVHFFLDDYRFETVWSSPERTLPRVTAVGAALTPDFSVWADTPRAAQLSPSPTSTVDLPVAQQGP